MYVMQKYDLVRIMAKAAQSAAGIIQSREYVAAQDKSEFSDIVTVADLKSERIIMSALREHYPACVFLTEESEGIVTRENFANHGLVFVIDPIDGTTNYKYGIPLSAISIGAWMYGQPTASVVYDLSNNDTYTAVENCAVYKNGKQTVNTNPVMDLKQAIVGAEWGYTNGLQEGLVIWNRLAGNIMALRVLGSATMALMFLLTGQYTCYIHNMMKPYDSGAAILMLKECGLVVTNWNGDPYSIFDKTIIAAPSHLYDEFYKLSLGK